MKQKGHHAMRFVLLAFALLVLPAVGREESTDFSRIGQMEIIVDGTAVFLEMGTTEGGQETTADIKIREDELLIDIMGVTIDNIGGFGYPTLSFRLPLVDGLPGPFAMICYAENVPNMADPVIACAPLGQLNITNFLFIDDGTVAFDFSAVALRRDDAWVPVPGSEPVDISGHVYVVIPARFRE